MDTELLRKRIKTTGTSVIVEGSLTGDLGNTYGIAVSGGLGGGWAREPHLAFAYGRVDFTRLDGVTSVDKSFAHGRYDLELARWVSWEAFVQGQSDTFQRMEFRYLLGTGPRLTLLHADGGRGETFDAHLGTAYMFERDEINPEPGSSGDENRSVQVWNRWSSYVTLAWQMDPRAAVATTLYVQPAIGAWGNVRMLSDTAFAFKISKAFSTGVTASIRYDSEPPTGVVPTDLEIKNTLALTF